MSTETPIDPGVRIGHVHLKVADLDRALNFYRGVLGFELTQRYGNQAAGVPANLEDPYATRYTYIYYNSSNPRVIAPFPIALAKYLSAHGRNKESDALFDQAEKIAPQDPYVIYERASAYVKGGRNLDEARRLLRRYLEAPTTPNDPPKSEAESLLRKIGA